MNCCDQVINHVIDEHEGTIICTACSHVIEVNMQQSGSEICNDPPHSDDTIKKLCDNNRTAY